jgi:TAT (twin-arginine translocation) pathway signal sequence
MKRRQFLLGLAGTTALAVVAGPVLAASYADQVISQLTKLGFGGISVEVTWLGRIRIVGTRADGMREIILNPRTGEILRDVWSPVSGNGVRRLVLDDVEDDGDDGNDNGDDTDGGNDDGGGDNSGSGSGSDDDGGSDDNSGSGSADDDGASDNSGSGDDGEDRDDDSKDD